MREHNVDVIGDKPMKKAIGEMSMGVEAKQKAWAEHNERLLNVESEWDSDDHLSNEPQQEGPPIPITINIVKKHYEWWR